MKSIIYLNKDNKIVEEIYELNKEMLKKEFSDYDDTTWSEDKYWLYDAKWNLRLTSTQLNKKYYLEPVIKTWT